MSFPRQVLPGRIYLVTRRCTQREFLLRPDNATTNAFVYFLSRAAERSGIGVVAFIANSNHYHAVVVDKDGCIPSFLEEFHKLCAKHQNALRGRRENFWSSEQTSLVELVGADDVMKKIIYTLANPVKDGMVEAAHHWPGASSYRATLYGKTLRARRPQRFCSRDGDLPERTTLECVRPPCLKYLTEADFRDIILAGISEVEEVAKQTRIRTGRRVLGRKAILQQCPTDRPSSDEPHSEIDPRIASRETAARIDAINRLKAFRAAYRAARTDWLDGKDAVFPMGTWWLKKFAVIACEEIPRAAA